MDQEIQKALSEFFSSHYGDVYISTPTVKPVKDTNYYYTVHSDSNVICLIPLEHS